MEYFVNQDNMSYIIETSKRDVSEEIVDQLVKLRKDKNMTQQDLADITGIARANIARIENCNYTPTIDVLVRYATALGMRLSFNLEELENQRPGRNKETIVDKTYIESNEYRRKFDLITTDADLNRLIYSKAKEMLLHRSGTEFEDMYWFDADSGKVLCYKLDELITGEIRHTKSIDKCLAGCSNIIAMHTHPHSMPPSPDDFNTFVDAGYERGIVICHNGTIYQYRAFKKINVNLWAAYVESSKWINIDREKAQLDALGKFSEHGTLWIQEVTV